MMHKGISKITEKDTDVPQKYILQEYIFFLQQLKIVGFDSFI